MDYIDDWDLYNQKHRLSVKDYVTDNLYRLIKFFNDNPGKLRGEFVMVVEKADKNEKEMSEDDLKIEIQNSIDAGLSLKDLSQNLSEIYGVHKKEIYQMALTITKK